MKQFGFIGMGNMGYAILKGLLKTVAPDQLIFSARNKAHMEQVAVETGVSYAADNVSCAKESSCLVLAVKPQQFDTVIGEIRGAVTEEQIIISIAPGITIENLQARFGKKCRIVRAMPNTPALVGEGMTGVCYDQALFSEEEKQTIETLFTSFGRMTIVEEKLMDAVVCASGSSPAYVYMFIEALADSAVKYGIPRADAYKLVAQTVLGSAKMVLETGIHPEQLKDNVCSPGGTTIAAVCELERTGFRTSIQSGIDACIRRNREMQQ